MAEFILRPFIPADAATILGWLDDETAFLRWSFGRLEAYPADPKTLITHYANAEAAGLFPMTMTEDGTPVGHLLIRTTGTPGTLHFSFIVVDGSRRGRGYGRRLLELALRHAFEKGAACVKLDVFAQNSAARRCYHAVGFTETGVITPYALGETRYALEMAATAAPLDLDGYWQATLAQDADAMAVYFTDDAVIDWPNTNERFNLSDYITANCTYPGDWTGEILTRRTSATEAVTVTHVESLEGASFHVTSFFALRDGKIARLTEYWGDDGEPPAWRQSLARPLPQRSPDELVIRLMQPDDYDALYALWLSCPGMGLNDRDDTRSGIAQYLARNPATCFVACLGNTLVGAIMAGHDGRRGFIHHTAVSPAWQRRGIGHRLVGAALAALRACGICKVALVTFAHNTEGNAFWEKEGFTPRDDLVYRNRTLVEMTRIET